MYDLQDRALARLMEECYYVKRGCILPWGPITESKFFEFDASAVAVDEKIFCAVEINEGRDIETLLKRLEAFDRRMPDLLRELQKEGYPPDWDLAVLLFVPENIMAHIQDALPAGLRVEIYALEWLEEDEEPQSTSMRDNMIPFGTQKH